MRSAVRTILSGTAIVLVLLLCACAATTSKGWRDGPARALLTDDQYRRFGELQSESERRSFIDRFWSEIGGETGGDQNTYRETFERRCEAAEARFGEAGLEGWKTDRGRVLLALGEPSSIRSEPGDAQAIEKEIWTYGTAGADPASAIRVAFYRCRDGRYRLDPTCAFDRDRTSVTFDYDRAEYFRKLRDQGPISEDARLLALLGDWLSPVPGAVPYVHVDSSQAAAQAAGPARASAAEPAPNVHALHDGAYFFRAADGTVLTLLTLEFAPSPDGSAHAAEADAASLHGAVTFEEADRRRGDVSDMPPRTLALDPDPAARARGRTVLVGGVHLRAGRRYALRYALEDGARDQVFVRNAIVGVPDLGAGFSASSIVPAEAFGPAVPGSGRFQVGSEEVSPKPGSAFHRSDLLRLYLQVYDAALDPVTAKPRVDVSFRFYRTGSGTAKRYGKPFSVRGAAGASMGLALPIGDWPVGPYRVEVELHDRVAERRTLAEGRFSILED